MNGSSKILVANKQLPVVILDCVKLRNLIETTVVLIRLPVGLEEIKVSISYFRQEKLYVIWDYLGHVHMEHISFIGDRAVLRSPLLSCLKMNHLGISSDQLALILDHLSLGFIHNRLSEECSAVLSVLAQLSGYGGNEEWRM